ncbi:hypothetical protein [Bythopirellula goksoeyrii]|uniref:Uncharacterized protein n=1 Tax=Bythopirellula goksoeyrii TaxID=1400387 RepID=A0A5B9QEN9_9BACT|nr:hypothetical protein [Bythopirellula goksoeyrii]QEG36065.1 hypothetical protein Pr1d_33740 [Bythopirellula goksoeyrii]
MKQKRSMDEALSAAKELRKNLIATHSTQPPYSDSHLKFINSPNSLQNPIAGNSQHEGVASASLSIEQSTGFVASVKPIWVRHTIGLRDATSISLRDAADGQKRKERHGQLRVGEPANEQEIADLGIRLALRQLGYVEKE